MRYLSVCSGIEAATVAWHPLGWEPVGFSEIDAFPSAVLAHRFPETPNFGDMTQHEEWPLTPGSIGLLVGGTPCQSFSVAGLRKGLTDPRGNLMLTYLAIANRLQPRWIVWENVPGVLSSNGGRDFGTFLAALGELGYGWAYRVVDAQWCRTHRHPRAVPQRRRRVFVVGCFGDSRSAAQVLFERESVRRDTAKSGAPRKGAAGNAERGATSSEPIVIDRAAYNQGENAQYSIEIGQAPVMPALVAKGPHAVAHYSTVEEVATTLSARDYKGPSCVRDGVTGNPIVCSTLDASYHKGPGMRAGVERPIVATHTTETMAVRRLTPRECERLQGFPDDWTAIPYKGKPAADGPRYKALGNSMAVNCMEWIGERIDAIEREQKES